MARRRVTVGVVAVAMTALATTSLAWACLPSSSISLSSDHGPSGSTVLLSGSGFANGSVASVYWDAPQSPPLASSPVQAGGWVTIPIIIPPATAEVHTVVAVAVVGGRPYTSRQIFEVTQATGTAPAAAGLPGSAAATTPAEPVASTKGSGINWVLVGAGFGLLYVVAGAITALVMIRRSRSHDPSPPDTPPYR